MPQHILEGCLEVKQSFWSWERCASPHWILDGLEKSQWRRVNGKVKHFESIIDSHDLLYLIINFLLFIFRVRFKIRLEYFWEGAGEFIVVPYHHLFLLFVFSLLFIFIWRLLFSLLILILGFDLSSWSCLYLKVTICTYFRLDFVIIKFIEFVWVKFVLKILLKLNCGLKDFN